MGGGRDLCIGAGSTWLANMDHRVPGDVITDDEEPTKEEADKILKAFSEVKRDYHKLKGWRQVNESDIATIDSLSREITLEQKANADTICKLRNYLPQIIEELEKLEDLKDAYSKGRSEASGLGNKMPCGHLERYNYELTNDCLECLCERKGGEIYELKKKLKREQEAFVLESKARARAQDEVENRSKKINSKLRSIEITINNATMSIILALAGFFMMEFILDYVFQNKVETFIEEQTQDGEE
jgi:hypothetical protein